MRRLLYRLKQIAALAGQSARSVALGLGLQVAFDRWTAAMVMPTAAVVLISFRRAQFACAALAATSSEWHRPPLLLPLLLRGLRQCRLLRLRLRLHRQRLPQLLQLLGRRRRTRRRHGWRLLVELQLRGTPVLPLLRCSLVLALVLSMRRLQRAQQLRATAMQRTRLSRSRRCTASSSSHTSLVQTAAGRPRPALWAHDPPSTALRWRLASLRSGVTHRQLRRRHHAVQQRLRRRRCVRARWLAPRWRRLLLTR